MGVTIERNLQFLSHIASKVVKISGLTRNLFSSTLSKEPEFMVIVYTMLFRPLIEYGSVVWNVGYVGDMRLLEKVQRRWTKSIEDFDTKSYKERLALLYLFSIKCRLLQADMTLVWKILHDKCAVPVDKNFTFPNLHNTRGHSMKLYLQNAKLDCRRRFFSIRVVNS